MAPKMLIVEDETPLRSLYELILTNREVGGGYDVRTAATAEEALEIVARETFDVVLTDYRLPGRDGISLLQEVRAAHPRTQCLLISGLVDAALVRQALEAGARTCLRKPCSIREMLQAVGDAARAAVEGATGGGADALATIRLPLTLEGEAGL